MEEETVLFRGPRNCEAMTTTQPSSLAKRALEFFLRTSFRRVLSSMIVLGVTLLGLSWTDVAALLLQTVGRDEQSGTIVNLAQLTGLGMIAMPWLFQMRPI